MRYPFFHVALPFCLKKTNDGKWFILNKQHLPLGWLDTNVKFEERMLDEMPIKYEIEDFDLFINELIDEHTKVERNENGEITTIYLVPSAIHLRADKDDELDKYFDKLKVLVRLYCTR